MIRLFIIILALAILCSCTNNSGELKQAQHDLRFTSEQLQTCQNQLEIYRSPSEPTPETNSYQEPEQPAQPSCETTELQVVYVEGKQLATCREATETACGIALYGCEDGYAYSCLKGVKYKTIEKEICE